MTVTKTTTSRNDHTSKQITRTLISATEERTEYTISTTKGDHMLIKLTEVAFATSGYGATKNIDNVITTPVWLNPNPLVVIS